MNWLANLITFTDATWQFVIGLLVVVLLLSLVVPYFMLRRDEASRGDTQLGLKVLFHFCFSVSLLAFLGGLTLVARGYLEEYGGNRGPSMLTDPGWSLALASGALALMYYCSLRFGTNEVVFRAAGRVFTFWRFAVQNFVVIAAAVLLALTLSDPPPRGRIQHGEYAARQWTFLAVMLVWGASWLIHLWFVWKQSVGGGTVKAVGKLSWDVTETTAKG
jgi:hypothetical protein